MNTSEERSKYKASMPRVRLEARHLAGCRLLPTREDLLDLLPKHAVAAEVGAAFGDFTREILRRTAPAKLHLVDSWESDRYRDGLADIEREFASDLATGRLELNRGYSTRVLDAFPDRTFDWAYVDTNHSYRTTAEELAILARKCKPDGRICGHDFTSGNVVTPVPYGVIEACHEFCVRDGWRYEYLTLEHHGHFSFCLVRLE